MKTWLIVILFLASFFIDGIIFPALFGFRESFLTVIFIVTMLLYYEVNFRSLILGVAFSWFAEFYWGLRLGTLILPLLVSAGTFFLLNEFFDVRNKALRIFSGVIMFIVFWEVSVFVTKIL